ncbi:hypothetical protein Avbf_18296 [Armadillidium vulgare]|nr:hypothetical protein Avbf_18296 [Armadillidium vulgare]
MMSIAQPDLYFKFKRRTDEWRRNLLITKKSLPWQPVGVVAVLKSSIETSEGKIEIGLVQRIITRRMKLGKPARRVPVLASRLGFQFWLSFGLSVLTHKFLTPVLIWKLVVASTATFESQFSTPDF